MRCMANALLLIPAGRDNLVEIEGDEFCTRLYIVRHTFVCALAKSDSLWGRTTARQSICFSPPV
jgi:hypothetical protein